MTGGPTKADLEIVGFAALMALGHPLVARPADGAGEEDQEFVVLAESRSTLRPGDVVRVGVEQARALQHAGRIGEPDRVPVGLDFAGGGPARAGATIEILKGRRVENSVLSGMGILFQFTTWKAVFSVQSAAFMAGIGSVQHHSKS